MPEFFDTIASTAPATPAVPPAAVPRWKRALLWALAGGLLITLAPAPSGGQGAPAAAIPTQLSAEIGLEALIDAGGGWAAFISPDGRLVVLMVFGVAESPLFLRGLDQSQAAPLRGTEGASFPFFSPDGRSIGFFAAGKLKTIPVTGGAVATLCPAANGQGGTWAEDGTITFQPSAGPGPLMRIPATGGSPAPVGALADGETVQRWPQALPGGTAILYTGSLNIGNPASASLMIQPLPSGTPRLVLPGSHGRYVKSGHIVYIQEGKMFAVPFDLGTLEVMGRAAQALEGVPSVAAIGIAGFSVSDAGTLVYSPTTASGGKQAVFWLDSTGATTPLWTDETDWTSPKFSPDGRQIAFSIRNGRQSDIIVYDLARKTQTNLTPQPANDESPVWTPKDFPGAPRIVFASDRGTKGVSNLYWLRADGNGAVQRLTESPNKQYPHSFDPSGKYLAFGETNPKTKGDLMILPIEGDEATGWKHGTPTAFLNTPANETMPKFSPDGKWMAYMADDGNNQWKTYVRPFPAGPGGPWLISAAGSPGIIPIWSRVRPELFFLDPKANKIMVTDWTATGDSFHADKPRLWSPGSGATTQYDVDPDGKRVAIAKSRVPAGERYDKAVFVFKNFFDELRRVAPAAKK